MIVGEGEAFPGMFLAINPGGITAPLIGTATTDPAFGLPAHWIDGRQREAAQMAGFTVVDFETVVATHLSHLMQVQASKLLSRSETQQLVEHVSRLAPKLIEEVVPKVVSIAAFQKVLQLLLDESVHIRDIRTIIESLAEHATSVTDPLELARRVRIALAPAIVQQIYGSTRELNVIAIDPPLERLLIQTLGSSTGPALDPAVAAMLKVLDLPRVSRLLVLNAGGQGDTLDDAIASFKSATAPQAVLSKVDEAVKMGPCLDAAVRHQLLLRGVTTGQRVPEDWEGADAHKLVRMSLRTPGKSAFDPGSMDLGFFFATPADYAAPRNKVNA